MELLQLMVFLIIVNTSSFVGIINYNMIFLLLKTLTKIQFILAINELNVFNIIINILKILIYIINIYVCIINEHIKKYYIGRKIIDGYNILNHIYILIRKRLFNNFIFGPIKNYIRVKLVGTIIKNNNMDKPIKQRLTNQVQISAFLDNLEHLHH